jgi:hypothetical protein
MNHENGRLDNLDTLIDAALASYTSLEPRPGLEQRILASVAAAGRPRRWGWRPLWALAAAAALIAVVAIPLVFRSARPTVAVLHPPAVAQHFPQSAPAPATPARYTLASHARPAATQSEVSHPLAQSSSGRLASMASAAPVTIALIRNQPLTDEPIHVKPISIAPIQIAALN